MKPRQSASSEAAKDDSVVLNWTTNQIMEVGSWRDGWFSKERCDITGPEREREVAGRKRIVR